MVNSKCCSWEECKRDSRMSEKVVWGTKSKREIQKESEVTGWENITRPLSLKTMEVHIKGNQWNKRFRTVQVNCHVCLRLGRALNFFLWRHLFTTLFPLLRHDQHLWIKESISDQMRSDITWRASTMYNEWSIHSSFGAHYTVYPPHDGTAYFVISH